MDLLISSLSLGLLWSIMAIGVYLTFRILDIADMTAEGSFPLGAAVTARQIVAGVNPWLATLSDLLAGCLAGFVSGFLHTKLKIPALLTGILTLTGLYSVNLLIMGQSNISLLGRVSTVITQLSGLSPTFAAILIGALVLAVVIFLLVTFFNTEIGLAARAVGDNEQMSAANGINADNMKIIIYMISNGLIALAGSLMAQINGYADSSMGIGTIVIALAAIIIAEVLVQNLSFGWRLITIIGGAIIYRLIIALVLQWGVDPNNLRLFYALMLTVFLAAPLLQQRFAQQRRRQKNMASFKEEQHD
ncbi:ABC transporter permease [Lapidilactobacillus gannanensis]|uniref:ABC transporter permease n=1 Tax=Lapidilactobacillus gannanensis TaxID=2486002 RepID=A0ABW4BP43_9LACO|nr:ABC transporter permease [Lapidilactobacillus gannanensis]